MTSKPTFDSMIRTAQDLRSQVMLVESKLFKYLIDFEESDLWKNAGYNTFAHVLKKFRLADVGRFEMFKTALSKGLTLDVVDVIGTEATIQAGMIVANKARAEYVQEAQLRVAEDGFAWSGEQARNARLRVQPDPAKPLARVTRLSAQERELAELQQECAQLSAENESLKAENAKLRKQLEKRAAPAKHP
jgi:hypothetical protein